MSGTKFRVKKAEIHTNTSGVKYEIGAVINQDFPIEAPDGATGKLLVNNDLEVSDNVEVTGNLIVGVNADPSNLELTGNLTVNAENTVKILVEKGQGSEWFTVKEVDTSNNNAESHVLSVYGNYYLYNGPSTVIGGEGLRVLPSANFDAEITASTFNGNLVGNVTGNLVGNVNGGLSGGAGDNIGLTDGNIVTGSGLISTGGDISLVGDLEGSATTIVKTNYINPVVASTLPGVLYIANEPSTSGTMEVSITDRANSVASLSLLEHVPGSGSTSAYAKFGDSTAYGAQLIYDGDNPNDSDDEVRLDTCFGGTTSNIFKVGRDSGNFELNRSLQINNISGNSARIEASDLILGASNLVIEGNIVLSDITADSDTTNTTETYYLGVRKNTNKIYRDTDSFFTGTHIYASDTNIPTGMAVELSSGKVALASTSNSKICVGVVTLCKELGADEVHSTSLGSDVTGGYICRLASVGDPLDRQCTGFNVCNENGDIQPGDLLVTSSTPGYLMKQSDDIIKSITVGKAMEAVTFDTNGQATGVYGFLYCG